MWRQSAAQVYDALIEAGKDFGIRSAGYYALRWLRIEKFYFYWGEDFDSTATPFEIGREMRVKFDKVSCTKTGLFFLKATINILLLSQFASFSSCQLHVCKYKVDNLEKF